MHIQYNDYVLERRVFSSAHTSKHIIRKGALLKVSFADGLVGFADCHPWPELGDRTIDEQISGLRNNKMTSLMRCSIRFAHFDAQARKQNKSLFEGQSVPSSHFLIPDILACEKDVIDHLTTQGYTHVKIKLGNQLDQEITQLTHLFSRTSLKLRFDFNEKLSEKMFCTFLEAIEEIRPFIDFIEDPFPFHSEEWKRCQDTYSVALASDRHCIAARYWPESSSFIIVKPAIHSIDLFSQCPKEKLIVTSYLDHPIGQLGAAYAASQLDPHGHNIHGLLSHHVYQSNFFSMELSQQGPRFTSPYGYGCGYEKQLASLQWKVV